MRCIRSHIAKGIAILRGICGWNCNRHFQRLGGGSWQNGVFVDFLFLSLRFFADFVADFSPHLCRKKCPQKSSRKTPSKILQNLYKIPGTFLQSGQPQNVGPSPPHSKFLLNLLALALLVNFPETRAQKRQTHQIHFAWGNAQKVDFMNVWGLG